MEAEDAPMEVEVEAGHGLVNRWSQAVFRAQAASSSDAVDDGSPGAAGHRFLAVPARSDVPAARRSVSEEPRPPTHTPRPQPLPPALSLALSVPVHDVHRNIHYPTAATCIAYYQSHYLQPTILPPATIMTPQLPYATTAATTNTTTLPPATFTGTIIATPATTTRLSIGAPHCNMRASHAPAIPERQMLPSKRRRATPPVQRSC
jgi:hypothetical protein